MPEFREQKKTQSRQSGQSKGTVVGEEVKEVTRALVAIVRTSVFTMSERRNL